MGKGQTDAAGGRSFTDNDIQREIFHGRIQNLFHRSGQAVDLVDEQNVAFAEIREQSRQIALLFNGRAGGNPEIYAKF